MSKTKVTVGVVDISTPSIHAIVRNRQGEILHVGPDFDKEAFLRVVCWPAADWARSQGYEIVKYF